MGKLRYPIGTERKSVYVRRRLFVLAGLLAVIAVIVLVIVKPGSSGGAATAPEVVVPDEILSGEDAKTSLGLGEIPTCPSGELIVTALTDKSEYAAGEMPQLRLRVENVGDAECQAQLGTAALSFRVTSGSDEVWRSTDCQVNADHRSVILEPTKPIETEAIEWNRTRSSTETCETEREQVGAGGATYHLHVQAAGVPSTGTASFLLY